MTSPSRLFGEPPWLGRSHDEAVVVEVYDDGTRLTGVTGLTDELPAAFQILLKLKPASQRDTDNLVTDSAGDDLVLTASHWDDDEQALVIQADTVNEGVDTLLGVGNGDPDDDDTSALCDAEVSYRAVSTDDWQPGKPFTVKLVASVNMPEDTTATPTPLATGIRYYQDITGLTGGGATKLDGITTAGLSVPRVVTVWVSSELQFWRLASGTDAESSPAIIRPDDYNASTNARVWTRVL